MTVFRILHRRGISSRRPSSLLSSRMKSDTRCCQRQAHTSVGIMQAEWDQQAMDQADDYQLRFTTQQGAQIRERSNHCCGLTAGR